MDFSTSSYLCVVVSLSFKCILDFLPLGTWCISGRCLIGPRVNESYFWYPAVHSLGCAGISFHPWLTPLHSTQNPSSSPARHMQGKLQGTWRIIRIRIEISFGNLATLESSRAVVILLVGYTCSWYKTAIRTNVWCETETVYTNILRNHKIISE